ncbi:ribonuclease III [Candidatus Formimonas warabiya]|uniref:Ribonuclease 3 n=2 Tax=Formimonas warabiya TaxID=1761012 RepID=A0A3G1L1B0_FORW1|nr:ribonuclease III [Candidatus Formimonas warabiya]
MLASLNIDLESYDLVNQALTHPTFVYEHKKQGLIHNQRLEFLGDAVLGLVVGDYLYHQFPERPEGDLTKMRAAVVCESFLAERARELNLGEYLLLGRGEEMCGGRDRVSILADAFEALLGAIYLGCGIETAKSLVINWLEDIVRGLDLKDCGDYKTMLQELTQKHGGEGVSYIILEESGPDHNKKFLAGVKFKERLLARGWGRNKKEAEQKAAQAALQDMDVWRPYLHGESNDS